MNETLIIHIGLLKTGTTTLQKRCFDQFDNAVTTTSTEEWKRNIRDDLIRLFLDYDPSIWNKIDGQEYLNLLKSAYCKNPGKPLFISREALLFPRFFNYVKSSTMFSGEQCGRFPVSLHLEALKKSCPWISNLKVLLTLRSQPQWLASLYAEQSNYIERASQEDFDQQVRRLLSDDSLDGGGFMNWGYLVQDLARVVGKNNLYVLLLEEINTYSYWKTLAEATDLQFDPKLYVSTSNKRENVRSDDSLEWSLRKRKNIMLHTQSYFRRPVDVVNNPLPSKKSIIPQSIRRVDWYWNLSRPNKFRLSAELFDDIRTFCSPFNQELARWLGRDFSELSELGY